MLIKNRRIPILKLLTVGLLPRFLKVGYYRLKGAKMGSMVHIPFGSIVESRKIVLEDGVSIGFGTIIRGRKVRIGRFTEIGSTVFIDVPEIDLGEDVLIREQVFVGGMETPESSFKVGNRSHIRQSTMINTSRPVSIGDDSAIGGKTLIFTHGTWQSKLEGYPCTFAPVKIGHNVWIAWKVFILPGVEIGDGVLVSAGSVVTKSIPNKSLASGNPATVVIPSGMYPRPVRVLSEKDTLMREIIRGSFDHLRFHHIQIEAKITDAYIWGNVGTAKEIRRFLYVSDAKLELNEFISEDLDLFVSLIGVDANLKTELSRNGCMWIDLEHKQRYGSTDLGEEMVAFFIRYGLRFERLD